MLRVRLSAIEVGDEEDAELAAIATNQGSAKSPQTPSRPWVRGGPSHPTRAGYRGKLYPPGDYASPICDSMTNLRRQSSSVVLTASMRRVAGVPVEDEGDLAASPMISPQGRKMVLCLGCGTCDSKDLVIDRETMHSICSCGIDCGITKFSAEFADTNATAKSIARCSASGNISDKFASAGDLVARRPVEGTSVSTKLKRELELASHIADRATDAPVDPIASNKHQGRLLVLIAEIDRLIQVVAPFSVCVARVVRMQAERLYRAAVVHAAACTSSTCALGLSSKPLRVMAAKIVVHVVGQLAAGSRSIEGVSQVELQGLRDRIANNPEFGVGLAASSHVATLAEVAALDVCQTPEKPCVDVRKSPKLQPEAPSQASALELRDKAAALASHLSFSATVLEAATGALTTPSVHRLHEALGDRLPAMARAYVLLRAVEQRVGGGPARAASELRRVYLQKHNLKALVASVSEALDAAEEDRAADSFYA